MASVTKEYNLKVNTKGAEANVDSLNEGLEQTQADLGGIENAGDQMTGGMISGFKGVLTSVKGAITGLKTMKGAIIATGIGALVIAVTSLAAAFTSTEEGQNKLNKIMGIMGSITGNLIDILAGLGDKLIWVFTSPREALTSFVELIKSQIINRFNAAIDTVGFLGSAIKKVFEGDFSGAMDAAKSAGSSYVDVLTGVENSIEKATEGVKGFVKEIVEEGKVAGQIADMRAKADKVERQLQIDRALADRERADLLEKAVDTEKFTAEQRIEFLKEAGRLEEEITNKEIAAAKLRYDAKVAENALAGSTKEDLDEEAALKAQMIQLETAKLTKAKEVTTQLIALRSSEAAALKAIKDQEIADEKEAKLLKDEEIAADKAKQEAADIAELERKQQIVDAEKAIEEQRMAQREATFQNAVALAGAESKLGKVLLLAKQLILAKEFIMDAKATILKAKNAVLNAAIKGSEAGVEVTGSVAKGANAAPPPWNIPFILTALLTGASIMSAVKGAMGATKAAAAAAGGGNSGGTEIAPLSITPAAAPPPPSLDSVASSGFNQLAGAIGEQSSEPVQAYVVSNDVTTAQSLERNIVDGASIG
jgi:hypothetical protein